MAYQSIFKRYEMKYLITKEQKNELLKELREYIQLDKYGKTKINSIYFDTPDYRLIRRSIEKPEYKEKLRIRSYGVTKQNSPVFIELKKKSEKVVYKRRIGTTEKEAIMYLCKNIDCIEDGQIKKEISYVKNYYQNLQPMVLVSYEREAYYGTEDKDFRVTFDDHILWREEEVSLCKGSWGNKILKNDEIVMEIKTATALPLWFSQFLSKNHIYKQSFSKYGTAYKTIMENNKIGGKKYA